MAFRTGDGWRKPALLAFAALAIIGWLLAGYLWIEAVADREQDGRLATRRGQGPRKISRPTSRTCRKSAGTAADLKVQATEAEKALSEASSARASTQNELADLTRQINDAKLAISGAQEEASAKIARPPGRGRAPQGGDRPARGAARPEPGALRRAGAAAGPGRRRARRACRRAEPRPPRPRSKLESLQGQIARRPRNSMASSSSCATPEAPPLRRIEEKRLCARAQDSLIRTAGSRCREATGMLEPALGERAGDRSSELALRVRHNGRSRPPTDASPAHVDSDRAPDSAAELKARFWPS